jgi:hypothetical protein
MKAFDIWVPCLCEINHCADLSKTRVVQQIHTHRQQICTFRNESFWLAESEVDRLCGFSVLTVEPEGSAPGRGWRPERRAYAGRRTGECLEDRPGTCREALGPGGIEMYDSRHLRYPASAFWSTGMPSRGRQVVSTGPSTSKFANACHIGWKSRCAKLLNQGSIMR